MAWSGCELESRPPKTRLGPLGIALVDLDHGTGVIQVFVNGVPVGQDGRFTPSLAPREAPRELVYGVPASVAEPGKSAVVALRSWSSPSNRGPSARFRVALSIGSLSTLQTAKQADWATAMLLVIPQLLPSLLLILLGLALLWPAIESRSHELILNALWLIFQPPLLILLALDSNHLLALPVPETVLLWTIIRVPGFFSRLNSSGPCSNYGAGLCGGCSTAAGSFTTLGSFFLFCLIVPALWWRLRCSRRTGACFSST